MGIAILCSWRSWMSASQQCASSVLMAGRAASVWRLWICLHFVASGLWLQRPQRPFPFTWGYASPGGWWSYIVLNPMVPGTLMTSLETNVYFHFPLQINKHMKHIYKTWYSKNFVVPSYITLPLIFINNWPKCFLKIYHSSLLEGIILSGQPIPGRLQVSIKISVCFFSSPIMIPFLLSHIFRFLNEFSNCLLSIQWNIICDLKKLKYCSILHHGWAPRTVCEMKEISHKGLQFCLYEMPRIAKPIATESRFVAS